MLIAVSIALLLRTSGDGGSTVVAPTTTATVVPAGTVTTACPGGPTAPRTGAPLLGYAATDNTIWAVGADGSNAVQLICNATGARNAAWSTSGRHVAHVDEDGALRILDIETGQDTVVDDGTEGSVLSASVPPSSYLQWSPAGDALIYEKFDPVDRRLPVGIWEVSPSTPPFVLVQSRDLVGLAGWSPDGQRIAYQLRSPDFATPSTSRKNQIFIMSADGSDGRKLTDGILGAWSPNGRLLACWKDDHGGSSSIGDVYIMDVDAGREVSLGEFTSDEHPAWSPDPNRHVFYNLEIDPDSLSVTPLFDRPSVIINWSPDGTKVAYIEGPAFGRGPRSLILFDLGRGQKTTLHTSNAFTAHALGSGYGGVWSGDSRYYAYTAVESTTDIGGAALYIFDTRSGATNRVWQGTVNDQIATAYSPDGSKLLVQQGFNQSPSVWVANADGTALTKIAEGQALQSSNRWRAWRPPSPE